MRGKLPLIKLPNPQTLAPRQHRGFDLFGLSRRSHPRFYSPPDWRALEARGCGGQKKGPISFSQYQSAKLNKPFRAAQFVDHISIPCLAYLQPVLGLHVGIGPSSAVSGVAITPYTQARPTIRTTILTARFMDCFSLRANPLGAGIPTRTNYTGTCQARGQRRASGVV
jgi:hypothetical protein